MTKGPITDAEYHERIAAISRRANAHDDPRHVRIATPPPMGYRNIASADETERS